MVILNLLRQISCISQLPYTTVLVNGLYYCAHCHIEYQNPLHFRYSHIQTKAWQMSDLIALIFLSFSVKHLQSIHLLLCDYLLYFLRIILQLKMPILQHLFLVIFQLRIRFIIICSFCSNMLVWNFFFPICNDLTAVYWLV